ncbi:MAG: hypothetical protein M1838_006088 [Thelocarpon superellum]|nr:MAG: hypothetical protein M1838_006088 [Thelocarpon superellum]
MSDDPSSPLLGSTEGTDRRRPASGKSHRSLPSNASTESTPLLSRGDERRTYGDEHQEEDPTSPAASSLRSLQDASTSTKTRLSRWPSVLGLSVLSAIIVLIIAAGFVAPTVVESYASQAIVFEPSKVAIDSFTPDGVRARIQGTFQLDASRVENGAVRHLGRAGTWIARMVESEPSTVHLYLPERGNVLIGTATIPRLVIRIRDGDINEIDFLTDLAPGEVDGVRQIANDWLEGRLGQLRLQGKANVGLKSGIFSLGTQSISESLVFEDHDLPAIPEYNITRMIVHEIDLPSGEKGMAADASLTLRNRYPVKLAVPPLAFKILVPNCDEADPRISLAEALSDSITIEPYTDVQIDVTGIVRQLPDALTTACPDSQSSPLDLFLDGYLHGEDTTIFVRGADAPSNETPRWIAELLSSVTIPLPFPGHTFDNLIQQFSLANVHFSLPDPGAPSGSLEAQPTISATVKALINLPREMNFPIDVTHVRADADVYYHGDKLGRLDLRKWQSANSTRIDTPAGTMPGLLVQSNVEDAPLEVTDEDVFTKVVQALVFGGKVVMLGIKADVDVEVETALGELVVKQIPAEGQVAVKPLSGGFGSLAPRIGSLKILGTSTKSISIQAKLNFTNPTDYSAHVPYVSVNILKNGTVLGQATAEGVTVLPGQNEDLLVQATWDPLVRSGKEGQLIGRELVSQYISGWNTTLVLQTYEGSIPSQPSLGKALSALEIELPAPRLRPPKRPGDGDGDGDGDDEDDGTDGAPQFIEDATMHLFSSTATFTLLSPLIDTTFFITHINATAFYNHTDPVGTILYDLPFAVPPHSVETPRLPVDWSLDSVGYEAVRKALGGQLKLDAEAVVGIKIGYFVERVWYVGKHIGAKVRL